MSPSAPDPSHESTRALVREALDEGRELIKLEVALARKEVEAEMALARKAAVGWAIAAFAASVGASMTLVALAIASGVPGIFTVTAAALLLAVASAGAAVAYRRTPRSVLPRTRRRLEDDVRRIGGRSEWRMTRTNR